MEETKFKLNNGTSIPAVGLGTWQAEPGQVKEAVKFAIKHGYRHIDCAYVYGNEEEVGQGIKEALATGEVRREDLFVTTKLWCTFHSRVEENLDKSLASLGLDYVDLYLMHWPCPMNPYGNDVKFPKRPDGTRDIDPDWTHIQTWLQMEKLVLPPGTEAAANSVVNGTANANVNLDVNVNTKAKTKAIGVANYSVKYLEALLPHATVVPAVNQIENHPRLPQRDVLDFCAARGIHVTAYSPLGSSGAPLTRNGVVKKLADKEVMRPSSVLVSFQVSRNNSVVVKSVSPSRICENYEIARLPQTAIEELEGISKTSGIYRFVFPEFGQTFGFPDKEEEEEKKKKKGAKEA